MSCPCGYLRRLHATREPRRHTCVPEVVRPASERRPVLPCGQRRLPGLVPHPSQSRLGDVPAVETPKQPAVVGDTVLLNVAVQRRGERPRGFVTAGAWG